VTNQEKLGLGAALLVAGVICGAMLVSVSNDPRRERARSASAADPGPKIQTVSTGQEVQLASYLVEGQRTVVEFTADW